MNRRFSPFFSCAHCLLPLLLLTGCETTQPNQSAGSGRNTQSAGNRWGQPFDGLTPEEVRRDRLTSALKGFAELGIEKIEHTATHIEESTKNRNQRKAAIYWKLLITEITPHVTQRGEPYAALLDAWAFAVRQQQYLETGDGKDIFGEWQPLARETANYLLQEIQDIAGSTFTKDQYAKLEAGILTSATAHPIIGVFSIAKVQPLSLQPEGATLLQHIVGIPLAPIVAIGKMEENLDPTRRLAQAAERFTDVVDRMPNRARWQLQLLAMELEETETAQSATKTLRELATTADQLADIAERYPAEIQERATALLEEVAKHQPGIEKLLVQADETTSTVQKTLGDATTTITAAQGAVNDFRDAGKAWETTVAEINTTLEVAQAFHQTILDNQHEDAPPFVIREYTEAAEALTSSAVELRSLLTEFRSFVQSDDVDKAVIGINTQVGHATDHARASALQLSNAVALRMGGLILFFFVCAVVYRRVVAKST